jgi:hypothetical protein
MLFQLLPNLLRNFGNHGLFPQHGKVQLIDKDLGEHVWSDEAFVQIPQKAVLQPERRCHIRSLVRGQIFIDSKVFRVGWSWQCGIWSEWRNVEVNPYRDQRGREDGL